MGDLVVPEIHINSKPIDSESFKKIEELRNELKHENVYDEYLNWCTDEQMHRFLIARQYKVSAAVTLALSALKWRKTRIPPNGIFCIPNWEHTMKDESECGKVYMTGYDIHQRPVIALDNSTTRSHSTVDSMQTFLAWSMDLACLLMPKTVDKYVLFFNLKNFSIFNCPPMKACTETVFTFGHGYPERLGHLIVYKPPLALYTCYHTLKGLMDAKTLSKFIFLTGDMSENSENDKKMCQIIGPNWRDLTRAEYPSEYNRTAGYKHDEYWQWVMEQMKVIQSNSNDNINNISSNNDNNNISNSSNVEDVKMKLPSTMSKISIKTDTTDNNESEISIQT